MRVKDISLYPLNELGFLKDQIIFAPVAEVEKFNSRGSFRSRARVAFPLLWNTIGTNVNEIRIAFYPNLTTLVLDIHGDKGFGRLTYENNLDGIHVDFSPIQNFVDPAVFPAFYADSLTLDKPTKTITTGQFYGDRDNLTFDGRGAPSLATIVVRVNQILLGNATFKEIPGKPIESRSVSLEDCILSARAGALIAHSTFVLPVPQSQQFGGGFANIVKSAASIIEAAARKAPADRIAAETRSVASFIRGDEIAVAGRTPDPDVRPVTPSDIVPIIDFVRLPSIDMDFNRLFVEAQTIIDTKILTDTFYETNKMLSQYSLYRMKDALDTLSVDSKDRDAIAFLGTQLRTLGGPSASPLLIYRSKVAGDAEAFHYAPSSVTSFRQSLKSIVDTPAAADKFEKDVGDQVSRQEGIQALLSRPLPHDHVLFVGKVSEATKGRRSWMKNDDDLLAMHPSVVVGSIQAKVLALAAESMIISSVRANARAKTAVQYLPGLRRLQEGYRRTFETTFQTMIKESTPVERNQLIYDVAGFNAVGALYAYGFANSISHIDTTDYRLGLEQGQFEGGKAIYDLLRTKFNFVEFGDLPSNASIDDILKTIENAANGINKFVQSLQQLVDQLKATVSNLESTIQATARDIGGAARGIRTLSYAGTGFLIGGPVGAGIGALLSLF